MKRKCLLVCVAIGTIALLYQVSPLKEERSRPVVATSSLERHDVYHSVSTSGVVQEKDWQWQSSEVTGTVQEVYVSRGETIQKDQVILKIVPSGVAMPEVSEEQVKSVFQEIVSGSYSSAEDLQTAVSGMLRGGETTGEAIHVKSAAAGTVMKIPNEGDAVVQGIPMVKVSDLSALEISVSISQKNANRIEAGQNVAVTISGTKEKNYVGRVREIRPFATKTFSLTGGNNQSMVDVIVDLKASSTDVKPGYSANVKIVVGQTKGALLAPYEAIVQEGKAEYVFAVTDGIVQKIPVSCNYDLEQAVEIAGEVWEGMPVVLSPQEGLQEGMQVWVAAS